MSTPQHTHPSVIEVVRCPGDFMSYAVAATDAPAGALLYRLESPPMAFTDTKRWSSVQVSETQHIELNSDFLFINHSCDPSLEFHVAVSDGKPTIEFRATARKDKDGNAIGIKKGDTLTFFYPSTEWEMDQQFDCRCKAPCCLGRIGGAKSLTAEQLKGYFLNEHIKRQAKKHAAALEKTPKKHGK